MNAALLLLLVARGIPAVAIVGLVVCLRLVVSDVDLVTGSGPGIGAVLALIPVAAFGLKVALGGRFSMVSAEEAVPAPPDRRSR